MNAENLYDAWDNGDRHEIRQQFAKREKERREWVGLTEEERNSFWRADQMTGEEWRELFDAIEAKLKEKNA